MEIQEKEHEDSDQSPLALLRDSYKSGLYLFGFIKIIKGKRLEKPFWTVSMLLILSFTFYMVYRNAARYAAYGVNTKIWEDYEPQRKVPVITICLHSTFKTNLGCFNNRGGCNEVPSPTIRVFYVKNEHNDDGIEATYLGNNCYVLNENGTMELSVGSEHQFAEVNEVKDPDGFDDPIGDLHIFIQSHEEFRNRRENIFATQFHQGLILSEGGLYEIHIREKHISREAPYSSNCIDGDDVSNIFSTKYTYDSCLETCAYNYLHKKCNATLDMWKKYDASTKQTANNPSPELCSPEVIEQIKLRKLQDCKCGRACKEIIYTATPVISEKFNDSLRKELLFYLKDPVTRVQIVPDYPLEAFLGSLGGVLGLGGKMMATLQLVIFLSLCIVHFRMR